MDIGVRHTPHSSERELEVTPPGGNVDWQMALLDGAGWKPTPLKLKPDTKRSSDLTITPPQTAKSLCLEVELTKNSGGRSSLWATATEHPSPLTCEPEHAMLWAACTAPAACTAVASGVVPLGAVEAGNLQLGVVSEADQRRRGPPRR